MAEDYKLQVTLKSSEGFEAAMVNVRGDNGEDLVNGLRAVYSAVGDIASTDQALKASFRSGAGATASAPVNGAENGSQAQQQASQPADPQPPAEPQQPANAGGLEVITDRFNNTFTFNLPTAPRCAHGVMALKDAKKRDGGTYRIYVCSLTARDFRQKTECADVWPPRN